MNCPYCNQDIGEDSGATFCPKCGHKFIRCSTCGDIITRPIKFCPKDGTKIPENQLGEFPTAEEVDVGMNIEETTVKSPHENKKNKVDAKPRKSSSESSESNKKRMILIGIIITLGLLILGTGSYFLTNSLLGKDRQDTQIADESTDDSQTMVGDVQYSANKPAVAEEAPSNTAEQPKEEISNDVTFESQEKDLTKISAKVTKATSSAYSSLRKVRISEAYSSSVVTDNGPMYNNEASQMVDGDETSSWQEGAQGDGIGENVYFTFNQEYKVKYITFKMGNWRDKERYNKNNRPKEISLELGGQEYKLAFPDGKKEYMVEFSDSLPASDLYLEIRSVYKGSEWDDTCISEMTVYAE